jgi:hypothetical protein
VEREGGREREQQINGVRDGALDRNGNDVGWKWQLVKKDTLVFLAKQINRTNRLSIKVDKSWMVMEFFCFTGASTYGLMLHCNLSLIIHTCLCIPECPNSIWITIKYSAYQLFLSMEQHVFLHFD